MVSTVSGILIFLQGILRVLRGQWAWELGIGEFRRHSLSTLSFAVLGLGTMILGVMVLIGAILVFKGHEKEGAVTILAFSTLSIFTGGGFLAGLILGVVGGAMALSKT